MFAEVLQLAARIDVTDAEIHAGARGVYKRGV